MGRAIYAVLSLRNHGIEGVIDPFSKDERVSGKEITEEMLKSVDCVIDFSSPECAVDNIKAYIDSGEPFDKAGGYGIQGEFGKYIDKFEGDYDTVVGLPGKRCIEEIEKLEL